MLTKVCHEWLSKDDDIDPVLCCGDHIDHPVCFGTVCLIPDVACYRFSFLYADLHLYGHRNGQRFNNSNSRRV